MKRISIAAIVLAGSITFGPVPSAHAVNPQGGNNNSTQPSTQNNFYSPSTLPGQVPLGIGNSADPFLNPNLYNVVYPTVPGAQPPSTPNSTVPNPAPETYPGTDGRSRLTNSLQPNYVPPGSQSPSSQQRKWRLGVYSKDLDTGVKIHDVVRGSAAERAGLEVNDLIVAVNGYQVGYVNGQLFDCGTEFDRLADENGWVTLLVQNNRDSKLINVPVQLDSRLATLKGSVALRNRQNLPANAILNVELKEALGSNSTPVTFASKQIENINQYPIPFSIDFDPAHISANGRYVVYASVLVNGREIYRTTQTQQIQPGVSRSVALQLEQVQPVNTPYPTQPQPQMGEQAQIAQIVKWFNDYLGRNPSDRELVAYLQAMRQGQSMAQLQLSLLANDQFFNRCDADKRVYIERMHEMLIGRRPTPEELNYWVARYDAQGGIRRELAREFQGALGIY